MDSYTLFLIYVLIDKIMQTREKDVYGIKILNFTAMSKKHHNNILKYGTKYIHKYVNKWHIEESYFVP